MDQDTKAKVIVWSVISILLLFVIVYCVVVFGDNSSDNNQQNKPVSFGAPQLQKKEYDYNKRIDLINEKGYVPPVEKISQEDTVSLTEENNIENPFLNEIKEEKKAQIIQKEHRSVQPQKTQAIVQVQPNYKQVTKQEVVKAEPIQEKPKRRKKRYLDSDEKTTNDSNSSFNVSESIPCRIYGDHKVTNYSKIKARITKDVTINGVDIKRNTIVTGVVQLSNSKVNIKFETIQYQNKTVNANMKAYSRDGLEGIYIEGGVGDDVKKDAYDEILDAASPSTVDNIPIVGDLIKSTTKKQNNKVYVDIPNDYTIYLKK